MNLHLGENRPSDDSACVRSLCERNSLIFAVLTASAMDNISETIDTSYEINATFTLIFCSTNPASFAFFPEMQQEDSEWAPPSDAELKVINARRERSDKISKLMSEYLLKGYKMLATTCPKCMTIELKTREGEIYCVACSEVDCEETSKDNPLLNRQAAESQLRENALVAAPKEESRRGG